MKSNRKTEKIAYLGLLLALAFVFSYVETLIPVNLGIPGAKLGLANLVTIVALYLIGPGEAAVVLLLRILLTGITFGNMAAVIYSLSGGILSLSCMVLGKKLRFFSMTGVSILGGVSHNLGQLLAAMVIVKTPELMMYFPVLLLAGLVAGTGIGILGAYVTKRLDKVIKPL